MGPTLSLIGGGLVILGSFLPWATVTSAFGSVSKSGTDGDGQITLIAGCLAALVAVMDIIDVSRTAGEVESAYLDASVGIGLWVVLAGAVVAVVGAWFLRAGRSSA